MTMHDRDVLRTTLRKSSARKKFREANDEIQLSQGEGKARVKIPG